MSLIPHSADDLYATVPPVPRLDQCWFYHTMDIPGVGTVDGEWDLRGGIAAYLGNVDLSGKRVLELGTASGYVCFAMEKQGAEVVAYDLSPEMARYRNFVPYANRNIAADIEANKEFNRKLNNGFWLSHHAFGSSARLVYGQIYAVPIAIGAVDAAVFGCILLHVRDPFLALSSAAQLVRETIIVTDTLPQEFIDEPPQLPAPVRAIPMSPAAKDTTRSRRLAQRIALGILGPRYRRFVGDLNAYSEHLRAYRESLLGYGKRISSRPAMYFRPDYRRGMPLGTWWHLPPELVIEFLGVLGFGKATVTHHTQLFKGKTATMYTVVARRS